MATWSISVSSIEPSCQPPRLRRKLRSHDATTFRVRAGGGEGGGRAGERSGSAAVAAEEGDLVLADARALLGVVDAEALARRRGRGSPSLPSCSLRWIFRAASPTSSSGYTRRQQRLDPALVEQPVGLPTPRRSWRSGTAIERLQLHPEVAVVELDHVARRRRARDDGAAALAGEDRRAHRLAAGVLEHDVGVVADERADLLAEPPPLALVLGVLVGPEPVALRLAVDDRLDSRAR